MPDEELTQNKRKSDAQATKPNKPGRKPGGTNRITDPQLTIQSYLHFRNTCYQTALLTGLFAVICIFKGLGMPLPNKVQAKTDLMMHDIWEHLNTRYVTILINKVG
jgi:hypothetical protein